jgi:hypothetical protein
MTEEMEGEDREGAGGTEERWKERREGVGRGRIEKGQEREEKRK